MQIKLTKYLTKNIFYSFFIIFIIINAVLILNQRLFPFIDLPQHLAYATIYKHIGESGNVFDQYFEFDSMFLKFNTFHVLFTSLDIWDTVELGNKIFYVLYIILFPTSILILIKKLGGNYWTVLFSFLLLYNFNVSWGFVDFMMAIPLCFLTLSVHYDYITKQSLKSIILLLVCFFFLYHLHLLSSLYILGLVLLQHLIFNRDSFKKLFSKGIVYLPFICLILWGVVIKSQDSSGYDPSRNSIDLIFDYYRNDYLSSVKYRLGGVFLWDNFFIFKGIKGILTGLFFSFFSIICLFWPFKSKLNRLMKNSRQKQYQYALSILIYTLLVYLLIFSKGYIYFRFSVLIFLSLIIIGSLLFKHKSIQPIYVMVFFICILYFILWGNYFFIFQKENKDFQKMFFRDIPKNRVLSGLIYEPAYRGKDIYIHFPDYYITWHHGIETSHIINSYPNYRLRRKVTDEKLPHSYEWISKTKDYKGNFDNMDYLLIKGTVPLHDREEIAKNFVMIREMADWALMINKKNK